MWTASGTGTYTAIDPCEFPISVVSQFALPLPPTYFCILCEIILAELRPDI